MSLLGALMTPRLGAALSASTCVVLEHFISYERSNYLHDFPSVWEASFPCIGTAS